MRRDELHGDRLDRVRGRSELRFTLSVPAQTGEHVTQGCLRNPELAHRPEDARLIQRRRQYSRGVFQPPLRSQDRPLESQGAGSVLALSALRPGLERTRGPGPGLLVLLLGERQLTAGPP